MYAFAPIPTTSSSQRAIRRRAFTLLELVVVLAILGLVASLALPVFAARQRDESPLRSVISRAQQAAVRRAESITLDIGPGGRWSIATGTEILHTGTLAGDVAALRLRITPLGACFAELPAPADWDAVACDVSALTVHSR